MLPWWRHVAPPGTRLHVAAVWRGHELTAILPALVHAHGPVGRARTMGAGMAVRGVAMAAPDAGPGDLACLAAAAARGRRVARLDLVAVEAGDPVPGALRDAWPGPARPLRADGPGETLPVVRLGDGPDAWWDDRGPAFRQRVAREERRLAARGVEAYVADAARHAWALEEFLRLHTDRWGTRSPLAGDAGRRMMRDAAAAMGPDGMPIHVLALGDGAIAVHVAVRAGHAAAYWNGGWDPRWSRHSPGLVGLAGLIRGAAARGVTTMDLGVGAGYKDHFTRDAVDVRTRSLIPWGPAAPAGLAWEVPGRARAVLRAGLLRLPPDAQARVRRARRATRRAR